MDTWILIVGIALMWIGLTAIGLLLLVRPSGKPLFPASNRDAAEARHAGPDEMFAAVRHGDHDA